MDRLKRLCRFGPYSNCRSRQTAVRVHFNENLFAATWQKVSKVRDIRTRHPIATMFHPFAEVLDMEFSDDLLALGTDDGIVTWVCLFYLLELE